LQFSGKKFPHAAEMAEKLKKVDREPKPVKAFKVKKQQMPRKAVKTGAQSV